MKQELTIAVALLATGGLLWFFSSGSNFRAQQPDSRVQQSSELPRLADSQNRSARPENASLPKQEWTVFEENNPIAQASYQQPAPSQPIANAKPILPESVVAPPASRAYIHSSSNPDSINLLARVAGEIANSNPFGIQLDLTARMFDRQIEASGNYYQQGQGSRKSKIELSFGQMAGNPKMLRVCDGRFVYTIHSVSTAPNAAANDSSMRSFEFIDLQRVQQAAREEAGETATINPGFVSPTGWVATGGIASLLQHLASGFNFGPPEPLDPDSNQVLLRGAWDQEALRGVVLNLDRNLDLGSPIQWKKVPIHIPHAVELVLNRGANSAYIPSQISFLRFNVIDNQITIERTMSLTFSSPQPLTNLSEGFFVVDSSNLEPTDATDQYIARIESFHQNLRSNVEQVAIEREPVADTLTK